MKKGIISVFLTLAVVLTLAMVPSMSAASAVTGENVFVGGEMNSKACLDNWNANGQSLEYVSTDGGYLKASKLNLNFTGFTYTPPETAPAGIYKFTGSVKTAFAGEVSHIRLIFTDVSGASTTINAYIRSDEWLNIETYITFTEGFKSFKVCGGTNGAFIQAYCMNDFFLTKVDRIPEGTTVKKSFGEVVTPEEALASTTGSLSVIPKYDPEVEAQYEVQGLVVNTDGTGFLNSCTSSAINYDALRDFALSFEGTHITDYVICVNNTIASYPSEVWTDVLDKYYRTEENGGISVDYTGDWAAAYNLYGKKGLDYIGIWCETFPTVGINPWLSFRMNDVHGHGTEVSHLLSDFYYENPQIRRVQHEVKTNANCLYAQDYTHELVREHMLDLINEALNRYDCYGIELDFLREMWLWYVGGEYNGIDILNDFMRDVRALADVYEKEYGHEIKIGIRCVPEIETNYDFGLDVVTWAAEGLIDMVSPCGRWNTTHNDVPVSLWKSVMAPYGVEVWPGMERNLWPDGGMSDTRNEHTLETYTAAAASYLSQGADKVYLFNNFNTYSTRFTALDRVTTADTELAMEEALYGCKGYFNLITTIGSYDKLMLANRRMILTYSDVRQTFKDAEKQLRRTVSYGDTITLRLPVGDVPKGASLTLKLGDTKASDHSRIFQPTVKVNSQKCTFISMEASDGVFCTENMLCYSIPESALDGMYATVEVSPGLFSSLTLTYAEIYIEAPDNAVIPERAEFPTMNSADERDITESPADVKPEGVQGIVIRANSDEVDASRLANTQVTDVVLTVGKNDPTKLISELQDGGITVYLAVSAKKAAAEAESLLDKYAADGIEIDFIGNGVKYDASADYSNTVDDVRALLDGLALSVRVSDDISTNRALGLDVFRWVNEGLVDMVCPSSNKVSDTNSPIRMWYSLLYGYDVTLAPVISTQIKTSSTGSTYSKTPAAVAGEAMNMLSKGADKVSVDYSTVSDRCLNVIGSYSTLIRAEKVIIPTWSDTAMLWQTNNEPLPMTANATSTDTLQISVGDTLPKQSAEIRFSFTGTSDDAIAGLKVYANSVLCEVSERVSVTDPITGKTLYCWNVPEEAKNSGHLVIEFLSPNGTVKADHAEVYIEAMPECGDANNDGKLNPLDVVYISRHVAGWDGYGKTPVFYSSAADIDGDGSVTAADAAVLARHIAKWNGYTTIPRVDFFKDAATAASLSKWSIAKQTLTAKTEGDTEYLAASGITVNYQGFTYNSGITVEPGVYQISCDLRTSVKGESSNVRLCHVPTSGEKAVTITNKWTTCTLTVTIDKPMELSVKICGGKSSSYTQSYDIANLSAFRVE